jgi:hypothetical protein
MHEENPYSSKDTVVLWRDVFAVIEEVKQEGCLTIDNEAFNRCLYLVVNKLRERADKTPKNIMAIKMLPWMCGECGRHEVQNLRLYEGGPSLIGTCDHCGCEWVS